MIKLIKKHTHMPDDLFICGLSVFFCSISILLVTIGVRQYHDITEQALKNQNLRTASSYLSEKFRQYDSASTISFTESNNIPLISLTSSGDEEHLVTYIYTYDGYLRELRQDKASVFVPERGIPIAMLQSLELEACSSNLYHFTLTDSSGNVCPIYISWNAK